MYYSRIEVRHRHGRIIITIRGGQYLRRVVGHWNAAERFLIGGRDAGDYRIGCPIRQVAILSQPGGYLARRIILPEIWFDIGRYNLRRAKEIWILLAWRIDDRYLLPHKMRQLRARRILLIGVDFHNRIRTDHPPPLGGIVIIA